MTQNPFTTYMVELKTIALKEDHQEQFEETELPTQIGKLYLEGMVISQQQNLAIQTSFMHSRKKDTFTELTAPMVR